ncbi:hypothetical protein K8352_04710 [Flavobacteriaceae bacterium F89]|uniref:Uncharacterized protein n=1 Tax=Cerina litoralis TaxID=2874477 RepID=A0AAE3JNM3_9FLAO|nr:hypothetical protein [Cerina litoralis]MCG2460036.1 hypothetical protein [Cerina litoralis]
METIDKNYGYIEWLSAEEMHEAIVEWMSELVFVRDEQFFLKELVRSHTLHDISDTAFKESQGVINALSKTEKELVDLLKRVQSHHNLLEIMVNDIDELRMERAYLETHWDLIHEIRNYRADYRNLKSGLFNTVSNLMKKNNRLLT